MFYEKKDILSNNTKITLDEMKRRMNSGSYGDELGTL